MRAFRSRGLSFCLPMRACRKRPASNSLPLPPQYADSDSDTDTGAGAASAADPSSAHPHWTTRGVGLQERSGRVGPDWARLVVQRLRSGNLLGCGETQLTLQLWADCGGLGTAHIAATAVGEALRQELGIQLGWNLYCYCDKDKRARDFVLRNFKPAHVSDDMEHRNFETKEIACSTCMCNHPLPESGIDLYVAGFPCTPWTRRGSRRGWGSPDIKPFKIGFKTIRHIQPALWLYEVPEGVRDHVGAAAESGLEQIQAFVSDLLGQSYTIQTATAVDPTWFGFPIRRPRVFMLGWRNDMNSRGRGQLALEAILGRPIANPVHFADMLKVEQALDWTKVGDFATDEDLRALQAAGLEHCNCREDPMELCSIHTCSSSCKQCGKNGLGCKWRTTMTTYQASHDVFRVVVPGAAQKLAYVHAMALHGLPAPESPRLRNFLNVVARLPEVQPLAQTLAVIDLSQTVTMASLRTDGAVPTLTTRSRVFSLALGRYLTTAELAFLMGYDLDTYSFQGCSESWFRARLGLCMHVASLGSMIAALLAVPLSSIGA